MKKGLDLPIIVGVIPTTESRKVRKIVFCFVNDRFKKYVHINAFLQL